MGRRPGRRAPDRKFETWAREEEMGGEWAASVARRGVAKWRWSDPLLALAPPLHLKSQNSILSREPRESLAASPAPFFFDRPLRVRFPHNKNSATKAEPRPRSSDFFPSQSLRPPRSRTWLGPCLPNLSLPVARSTAVTAAGVGASVQPAEKSK